MGYLLFFVYFILLAWLLTKIKFVKKAGLPAAVVVLLFAVKVTAGVAMGWVFRNDINADTWQYHRLALDEYRLLLTHPVEYFTNLFDSGYEHKYDGVLQMKNSYWNDLRTNLVIKLVSVLHIFSFGNFWVNVVLFNFITFFGHIALFRTFKSALNGFNSGLLVACFLLPSLLLFSSMIHKDGIIFFAISFVFYALYALKKASRSFAVGLLLLISLGLVFLIRSYIFIALIPAATAWFIAADKPNPVAARIYAIVFSACILLFFASFYFSLFSFPGLIVEKQSEFLSLEKAHSFVGVPALKTTAGSFIAGLPSVISHVLFRPFFTDYSLSKLLLAFAVEWYGYLAFALIILFRVKQLRVNLAFTLFIIMFAVIMLLLIGYTVPILWAIVRYRSIYLPFLLAPLFSRINWKLPPLKHLRI